MKKILFVCDGNNLSTEAFEFVKSLYKKEPFLLTGAFFHSLDYGLLIPNTFAPGSGAYLSYTEEENEEFYEGINEFKRLCEMHNIEYHVHEESGSWKVPDLVKESRFTDLMIISGSLFFSNVSHSEAKAVLQQTLHSSECSIIVVPDKPAPINEIVFAYDGTEDSVFALKQFAYLFPDYTELETTIVYINDDPEKEEIPDLKYIKEFAAGHFKLLSFIHLNLARKTFPLWLTEHKNVLLVSGSYNRSYLSMRFKKSFVQDIINSHNVPVFISHP